MSGMRKPKGYHAPCTTRGCSNYFHIYQKTNSRCKPCNDRICSEGLGGRRMSHLPPDTEKWKS